MFSVIMPEHFAKNLKLMPNEYVNGRSVREGYMRSIGIQFGNIIEQCKKDPIFNEAYKMADGRSSVDIYKLINIYVLIKYFLGNLPFGHIAEFGAHRGGSALFMAKAASAFLPGVKVFAFDTFSGMPETSATHDAHGAGDFSGADPAEIIERAKEAGLDNLVLVKGLFDDSIPPALPEIGAVRLAHIDCDIYAGVVSAYDGVKSACVPGAYIILDDALISTCLGAFTAAEEVLIRRDNLSAEQVFPHLVFRQPRAVELT